MSSVDLGWIGAGLLVLGAVVIAIEGALAGAWMFRLARRAQELNKRLAIQQGLIQSDLARLRAALSETARLWQPYGRLLRFLRHPLVIALLQSYSRRRAEAR